MAKRTGLTIVSILAVLVGCTPPGGNVVNKSIYLPSFEESSNLAFVDPDSSTNPETYLDPAARTIVRSYGTTIKHYAQVYGFDWRLVLAIMKQESSFRRRAESPKGATGLMQIMPVTGEEVARVLDIENLSHPRNNIRGGIYYLKQLYDLFGDADEPERTKLALAAYNAGLSRVFDAQMIAAYLHDDPDKWQSIRDALPLLSKRYYTLHRDVWRQDKPRSGWFGNARETVAYVDAIMNYYDEYRLLLN